MKKKVVMTFGTFDVFHPGHEFYLSEARKKGDYLITIIARDKTVVHIKSRNTRESELVRLKNVEKSSLADEVLLGSTENYYAIIGLKKPDVLCFGYDQRSFNNKKLEEYLEIYDLHPKIVIIPPFEPEKWKSSKL